MIFHGWINSFLEKHHEIISEFSRKNWQHKDIFFYKSCQTRMLFSQNLSSQKRFQSVYAACVHQKYAKPSYQKLRQMSLAELWKKQATSVWENASSSPGNYWMCGVERRIPDILEWAWAAYSFGVAFFPSSGLFWTGTCSHLPLISRKISTATIWNLALEWYYMTFKKGAWFTFYFEVFLFLSSFSDFGLGFLVDK